MLYSSLITMFSLASVAFSSPIPAPVHLEKRQSFSGRATFYDVGLGACGQYNVESDYIVALNTAQYGSGYPGPNCGRSITISYGGKTAQATIMDQCPSCGYGDLDLSRSLFNHFSDPGAGVFQMSWSYNDGNSQPEPQPEPTTTKSKYTPSPTPTPTPTPTSTWTPPSSTQESTSTWTPAESSEGPPPTSTSTSTSSSNDESAASAPASSSGSIDPYVVPLNATVSGTVVSIPLPTYALPMGNLVLLNQMVMNLGAVIVIGAQVE